jgi:hypothetical protein
MAVDEVVPLYWNEQPETAVIVNYDGNIIRTSKFKRNAEVALSVI